MRQVGSLNHSRWECKYHVVFIPKYRKKTIFGQIRSDLGDVLRRLAEQKESRIEEGHLMPDHVHMMISIPPKHAVSQVFRNSGGGSRSRDGMAHGVKKCRRTERCYGACAG
jgi:putative transposase